MQWRHALPAGEWLDPAWWLGRAMRAGFALIRPDGCAVVEEDWDNLVILDGCRYDLFEAVADLPGRLEQRTSLGSATPEFLRRNFADRDCRDTVYVTANPMLRTLDLCDTFHETVDVWRDGWSDEHGTVLPDAMREATQAAYREYPDKRLVAHFMQPHYPFVGPQWGGRAAGERGFEWSRRRALGDGADDDGEPVWELLRRGEVDEEAVLSGYRENLEVALDAVDALLDTFEERTVVTSDHGNLAGEYAAPFPVRMYGHPEGIHTEKLVTVPWLVVEGERRKRVVADAGASDEASADPLVGERLSALGYAEDDD